MKSIRTGARIGLLCSLAFVAFLWLIQFVSMVLAPDRDGPDWRGFLFVMLQTLVFASPMLLVGAVIGAVVGVIAGALAPRLRKSRNTNEPSEPSHEADP
jgi:hypothetical protein